MTDKYRYSDVPLFFYMEIEMKYTVKNPKIVMTQDDVTFEFSAEQTEIEVSCFESTSLIDSFKNLVQEIINTSNSKPKKKEENNG